MTDLQTRKQNMAVVTEQVMDDNASLWNTTPAIGGGFVSLGR